MTAIVDELAVVWIWMSLDVFYRSACNYISIGKEFPFSLK